MPLGEGYTAEEQLTGTAEHGGLQILVHPMTTEAHAAWKRKQEERLCSILDIPSFRRGMVVRECASMGMAPGGLMRQQIHKDHYGIETWDPGQPSRCFVHLLNSTQYAAVTGERPPRRPFRAKDYADAGLPWFHHYSEGEALQGAEPLAQLTSLAAMTATKTGKPIPDNEPLGPLPVTQLGEKTIRVGEF